MASAKEAKRLRTAIYFHRSFGKAFQEVARRIRNEKVKTILVWANKFKGPESLIENINAVVIQKSCNNASKIASAYESFGNAVEIHYADDDGEFIEEGSQEDVSVSDKVEQTDATVQVEAAADEDDSKAAGNDAVDARSDEKFFEDAAASDEESANAVGSTDGKLQE